MVLDYDSVYLYSKPLNNGDAEQEQMGATIYPRTCQEDKHIRSTEQRIDTNDSVFESNSKSKLKIFISDKN